MVGALAEQAEARLVSGSAHAYSRPRARACLVVVPSQLAEQEAKRREAQEKFRNLLEKAPLPPGQGPGPALAPPTLPPTASQVCEQVVALKLSREVGVECPSLCSVCVLSGSPAPGPSQAQCRLGWPGRALRPAATQAQPRISSQGRG